MTGQVILAALLGAVIGLERERHGREAGIRTYASVALGACIFGLISSHALGAIDKTRLAAQVVSGIGFLGAGVIMHGRDYVSGLTTAATLWATAAVGLAVAFQMYTMAILATCITFGLLAVHHVRWWPAMKGKHGHGHKEARAQD